MAIKKLSELYEQYIIACKSTTTTVADNNSCTSVANRIRIKIAIDGWKCVEQCQRVLAYSCIVSYSLSSRTFEFALYELKQFALSFQQKLEDVWMISTPSLTSCDLYPVREAKQHTKSLFHRLREFLAIVNVENRPLSSSANSSERKKKRSPLFSTPTSTRSLLVSSSNIATRASVKDITRSNSANNGNERSSSDVNSENGMFGIVCIDRHAYNAIRTPLLSSRLQPNRASTLAAAKKLFH